MTRRGFINAKIHGRSETAFLVDEGQFILFGSDQEISKLLLKSEELIDLQKSYVLPGFIDSHLHLVEYGHFLKNLDLKDCTSLKEVLDLVAKRIQEGSQFVIGRGYDETRFSDKGVLNKDALDKISRDIPISLTRVCGHQMVVNSKVLEMLDFDETSYVEGGSVDVKQGILEESAINLVHELWPEETIETIEESILLASKKANEKGVTTVGSDDFLSISSNWKDVLDAYLRLSYQGKMTLRVQQQCEFATPYELAAFLDEGYTTGMGDDFFTIGPLKMVLDGSFGARSAALKHPYADDANESGVLNYETEELEAYMHLAGQYNMPTITHVIGDRALAQALSCFEKEMLPGNPLLHGLVHCSLMDEKQREKVKEMQLVCYVQSLFIDSDAEMVQARLGKNRLKDVYCFKDLAQNCLLLNGSDAPVEEINPLKGIKLAVTRTSNNGVALNKDEAISLDEAIDSYTKNCKLGMGLEQGELERFHKADFVVLEKDLHDVPVEEIDQVNVLMTIVDGEIVFEKK